MANTDREPFPSDITDFNDDPRISFSKTSDTYVLEAEDGTEWEWLERASKWIPVTNEDELERQQQAYKVEGIDESEPAVDIKKRKAQDAEDAANAKSAKKQKAEAEAPKERKNTAVYVTSLPRDVDIDELHQVFSRFGLIAESLDSEEPRIKMYIDENGKFKGEALIVFFRPESVQLAINLLDDCDFRLGQKLPTGPMRVREADASYKSQKDQPLATEQAKKKGTQANHDRQKAVKKAQQMNNRLADWDDDDPQAIPETSSRWDKVIVLKNMFTLKLLEEDAAAYLDIKEDVREECEKIGAVTNVVLYDKEEEGVVTVRFADARAASAAIKVFDGRIFDGKHVVAYVADGKERFMKSGRDAGGGEEEELKRLEKYAQSIEKD